MCILNYFNFYSKKYKQFYVLQNKQFYFKHLIQIQNNKLYLQCVNLYSISFKYKSNSELSRNLIPGSGQQKYKQQIHIEKGLEGIILLKIIKSS
ncbi:hypothetical protein ABPG74_019078 [Tetrahymena malaccensis]